MGPLQEEPEQTGLLFLRGQTARTIVWLLSARKALSKTKLLKLKAELTNVRKRIGMVRQVVW